MTKELKKPRLIYNADKSKNLNGAVTHMTQFTFQMNKKKYTENAYVTNIGEEDLILSLS